jgi:5-methyltetrahydrofolate--homocysteine methyltransferase
MQPFHERLADPRPIIGDGAMGTLLIQNGLQPGACPEAMSLTHADLLTDIAARYIDAGAEIVETNTFGGSPLKLAFYGLQNDATEINAAAVRAARKAAEGRAYVAGSCGPTGKMLKPYGDAEPADLAETFRAQIAAILDAGADLICVETMTDAHEARLAVAAARQLAPDIPILATMTFDRTPRGFFTIMRVSIDQAATELTAAGANVVGANCGHGVGEMIDIARGFRAVATVPCMIQANAGIPETRGTEVHYPDGPAEMAAQARQLVDVGVKIIGGCCGTTPEHIHALRAMVDSVG